MFSEKFASGIKESELDLLKKMFRDAPVFMCILKGFDHRIVYVNPKMRELYGNRSVCEGTPAREVWPELQGQGKEEHDVFERLTKIYETGVPYIINEEKIYLDRTNTGKLESGYFNFVYQPLKDEYGKVHSLFITGQEVTSRVRARKEKKRAERRFRIASEGAELGFWEVDAKNETFRYLSDQAKALLGLSPEDTISYKDFFASIHPDDIEHVKQKVADAVEESVLHEVECRVFWPDRSLHWLLIRGYTVTDRNGVPKTRLGISIDITDQKEVEKELKKAVKVRDDFIAIASHELQTPITSLKTRTELLEIQLRDEGKAAIGTEVGKIKAQIDQLSKLANSLLDITRIGEGELTLKKEVFSLEDLTQEILNGLNHMFHHSIIVQTDGDSNVYADRYRIGQALTNMINNAIKYSPKADEIIIDIWKEHENVFLSVTDFGIGITKSDQQRVFDQFFRGHDAITFPGIGIGLYICAEIIARHGSHISVKSRKGEGSTFTFSLSPATANQM